MGILAFLNGWRAQQPQHSAGDFVGDDYRRTPAADINRRALYEAQSAVRQQFQPLPQAPPPPPQLPGLQAPLPMPGLFGRGRSNVASLASVANPNIPEIPEISGAGMGGAMGPPRSIIPDAPGQMTMAQQEAQAFNEARQRAMAGIAQDGYPYGQSPALVQSQSDMLQAVEQDRRARAERERREGVSFDDWWRWGGRQDERRYNPSDPPYRFYGPPRG